MEIFLKIYWIVFSEIVRKLYIGLILFTETYAKILKRKFIISFLRSKIFNSQLKDIEEEAFHNLTELQEL